MRQENYRKRQKLFWNLKPLVLASRSPRRKKLLQSLGLDFEVIPPLFKEPPPGSKRPEEYVVYLSLEKAKEVALKHKNKVILAADTIVVWKEKILGKPRNPQEAIQMLMNLSNDSHKVFTGYTILYEERIKSNCVKSLVFFKKLDPLEIKAYVSTGEPMDKAGAYAVQGIGSYMIREIKGSVTNVIGLPLAEVIEDLLSLKLISFRRRED